VQSDGLISNRDISFVPRTRRARGIGGFRDVPLRGVEGELDLPLEPGRIAKEVGPEPLPPGLPALLGLRGSVNWRGRWWWMTTDGCHHLGHQCLDLEGGV
jgi:hypothetical protein